MRRLGVRQHKNASSSSAMPILMGKKSSASSLPTATGFFVRSGWRIVVLGYPRHPDSCWGERSPRHAASQVPIIHNLFISRECCTNVTGAKSSYSQCRVATNGWARRADHLALRGSKWKWRANLLPSRSRFIPLLLGDTNRPDTIS